MSYLQKFYDQAFHWLITFGPKLIIAIIVLIIGQWLLRIVNKWLRRVMDARNFSASVKTFLQTCWQLRCRYCS